MKNKKVFPNCVVKLLPISSFEDLLKKYTSFELMVAEAWLEDLPHSGDFLRYYLDDFIENLEFYDFDGSSRSLKQKTKACEKVRDLVWGLHFIRQMYGDTIVDKVLKVLNK